MSSDQTIYRITRAEISALAREIAEKVINSSEINRYLKLYGDSGDYFFVYDAHQESGNRAQITVLNFLKENGVASESLVLALRSTISFKSSIGLTRLIENAKGNTLFAGFSYIIIEQGDYLYSKLEPEPDDELKDGFTKAVKEVYERK